MIVRAHYGVAPIALFAILVQCCSSFSIPSIINVKSAAASCCTTTSLAVSIGLGPEKKDSKDRRVDTLVAGVDYEIPDHESHRLDRRSKLDERCDEWFGKLLDGDAGVLKGKIADSVKTRLMTLPKLVNQVEKPFDDPEWTPYVNTKLPWSVIHPSYGLEAYGLPIPRRNAETWRHFDVAGMVNIDIDGSLEPKAPSKITDSIRQQIMSKIAVEDQDCAARLVYINGQYVPELSITTETVSNIGSNNIHDKENELAEDQSQFLMRLTDGWTDSLLCDVPVLKGDPLTSFQKLSTPNHNVGAPETQFAINTQQGTACFAALNTYKTQNVGWIRIQPSLSNEQPKNEKPILVIHAITPNGGIPSNEADEKENANGVAIHPRTVIIAEEGASACVVQSFIDLSLTDENNDATFTTSHRPLLVNSYTQVWLKANANITHCIIDESGGLPVSNVEGNDAETREKEAQRPALANTILETLDVHCAGEDAHYDGTVLAVGANGRSRLATSVSLLRPGATCELSGFSLAGGTCRTDIKTNIHHIADGCKSVQLQKNMVGGRATTSFRGRVRVEQSAQQTNSQQLSRTVLLTDKARAWAVPSLEIIADDVQCTHGATVSDLSEEELFYLRSRGLDVAAARNLLMYAYCNDVLQHVPQAVLGELKSAAAKSKKEENTGLQMRILRRLENVVPTGKRAIKGEFQSV